MLFWGILITHQAMAGKYAGEFLRIGVGSRALGMGGAFVALADDGTASYWNPAGLGNMTHHQLHFGHVQMFNNLAHHHFANLTLKLSTRLGIGISWLRLAIDDIPRYGELIGTRYDRFLNPDLRSTGRPEGFFGDLEDAVLLSFGKSFDFDLTVGGGFRPLLLPTRLSLGLSYKYISEKLDRAEGRGQGLDLGVKISFLGKILNNHRVQRNFSMGINFQDITGTTILWNTTYQTRDQIPQNLLIGVSYSERLSWLNSQITFSMGRDNSCQSSNHYGGELNFSDIFSLRVGINDKNFTAGTGLHLVYFSVDYAFVSNDLGNCHRVSGSVEF